MLSHTFTGEWAGQVRDRLCVCVCLCVFVIEKEFLSHDCYILLYGLYIYIEMLQFLERLGRRVCFVC